MKILYLFAHPSTHSLNALLKTITLETLESKDITVETCDLYQQHWQAVASYQDFKSADDNISYLQAQTIAAKNATFSEDISHAQAKLMTADHIVLEFPLWWFSVPAILKGWFDRVIAKGVVYDMGQVFDKGRLVGKTASLTVTTQSPEQAYQISGVHGETLDNFLRPITHTLRFTGIKVLPAYYIYDALTMPVERLQTIKQGYTEYLQNLVKLLQSR